MNEIKDMQLEGEKPCGELKEARHELEGVIAEGRRTEDRVEAIKISVKSGREMHIVEIELGKSVSAILEFVADKHGCSVEELILVRNGEDEPLATVIVIDEAYPHNHQHHVHFKGPVKVTVNYQTAKTHEFKRNTTVEDVLEWAIRKFEIDPTLASEFDLALHGMKEALPPDEHIGHLAHRHDELAFDLIRGDISNGSGA